MVAINQRVFNDVSYTIRLEPGVQTPEETLQIGSGSCRDSAWLQVQLLRHLGLAARFVSGYLVQLTSDQKSLDGPSGPVADFTDLHAWTEVYIPGAGWVGLDPTSGLFAAEGHIPLSCTPQPVDAAPLTGAHDECEVEFGYRNEVSRIKEDPRVTKPFTDQEWDDINRLGDHIDGLLQKNDVRLTMGGEPTFVSIDDMESAQWNTEADGPHKRQLAATLTDKLKAGVRPRRPAARRVRANGTPASRCRAGRTAYTGARTACRYGAVSRLNRMRSRCRPRPHARCCGCCARRWNCRRRRFTPATKMRFTRCGSSSNLPLGEDPTLDHEALAQRTLAQIFERGLNKATGYCLPLGFNAFKQQWQTCRWRFRQNALYLAPGNSPLGLRLPLTSLSQQARADALTPIPSDPFAPVPQEVEPLKFAGSEPLPDMAIHTALCAEVRDGKLYVFLPPLATLEQFCGLVDAIADAANELRLTPYIEGYQPPFDTRLNKLAITPDPGVIEVNVQLRPRPGKSSPI